jgi:hypothetical protein
VFATVATSAPPSTIASALEQDVTLPPGGSFERKIDYEASHPVSFQTQLSGAPEVGTRILIEYVDTPDGTDGGSAAGGCADRFTYDAMEGGSWAAVGDDGATAERFVQARTACEASRGVVTLRITSEASEAATIHVSVRASIAGFDFDEKDAPDGAFVLAKVVP